MKKTIAILLVAVLAAGSVFAGFSGSASVSAGYNFETKDWGFFGNDTGVKLDFELGSAVAEKAGEGKVYASIKASLAVDAVTTSWSEIKPDTYWQTVGVKAKISEAKVYGDNWSVSILGLADQPDFAKSAIDSYKDTAKDDWGFAKGNKKVVPVSYSMGWAKAPGLEATYAGYTVGAGIIYREKAVTEKVYENKEVTVDGVKFTVSTLKEEKVTAPAGTTITAYAKTPEYDFNGLKAQFAVAGAKAGSDKTKNVGLSAKASYATDVLSASVATDLGLAIADETKFGADVAINAKYDFVTVDGYYATKAQKDAKKNTTDNLLSVKVATDLNGFNVPVKLTLAGKDLINKQNLSAEVEVAAAAGLTVKANGGYGIADKKLSAGAGVEYKTDAFKATADVGYSTILGTEKSSVVTLDAAVESEVLVPGATLKLAYGAAKYDQNLLDGQTASDVVKQDLGKVVASATIKF